MYEVIFPQWYSPSDIPPVIFPQWYSSSDIPPVIFPQWYSPSNIPPVIFPQWYSPSDIAPVMFHSFPKASLFENHSLLGTNNVRGQIPENNFPPNGVLNSFIWFTQKKNFTVVRNVICAPFPRQQMDVVHSATPVHACHTCFYLVVTLASLSLRLRWSGTTLLQCRCHMLHCPYRRYSSCQRCPELCSLHTLICNMAKTELKNVCACPKLTCQYIATVNIC